MSAEKNNKKKKKDEWRLVLLPGRLGKVRNFRVTRRQVRAVVVFFAVLGCTLGYLAFEYGLLSAKREEARELRRSNAEVTEALNEKEAAYQQLRDELGEMNNDMARLTEFEDKLRAMTGLGRRPVSSEEDGTAAQGGPGVDDSEEVVEEDIPIGPISYEFLEPSELKLEFLAREQAFAEILDVMETEQVRLAATPSIWPVDPENAWISSGYGYRKDPLSGRRTFHSGTDVVGPWKTEVVATADGVVSSAGWDSGLGYVVSIDHGFGFKTRYAHNHKLLVKKGDRVKRGDPIALEGNKGRTTGAHVHYEVYLNGKTVNPYKYMIN